MSGHRSGTCDLVRQQRSFRDGRGKDGRGKDYRGKPASQAARLDGGD
jgi:hypothetical protein